MNIKIFTVRTLLGGLLKVYLLGMLLLSLARLIYFFRVFSGPSQDLSAEQIIKAFLTGLRFDSVVMAYGLMLPLLVSLSSFYFSSERAQKKIWNFNRLFSTILFAFITLILIIDNYYYIYFQSHINILFLGFFEDDTGAVLQSVWSDYPLLKVLFFLGLTIWLYSYLFRKIFKQKNDSLNIEETAQINRVGVILIYLSFFIIALRASFGTFPVQIDDAVVSNNASLNLIPVNGVFALKETLSLVGIQSKLKKFDKEIDKMKYSSRQKAFKDYFGSNYSEDINKMFFSKTDTNEWLRNNPPNVVFFLMESMSNNNLNLQRENLNVYGRLEAHLDSNIFFRKFLPIQNGTINTLEAIMVNTPVTSLAQSKFSNLTFPSSVAKPFMDHGYTTSFITGGKINWRNIQTFIPEQYFQVIEGDADIIAANPATEVCEWGVYDEFLFGHIFNKLKEDTSKPKFIYALTTTNHTPFHLPDSYKALPVILNDSIKQLLKVDEELAIKNLSNFQYSNDCLGRFLDMLNASPLKNNTIVIASGDHNNIMLFDFTEEQTFQKLSVPLFLSVPKQYLNRSFVDTSRWGSHNDIFPTVFNLALSDAIYFKGGNNLLDPNLNRKQFVAYDMMSYVALNDDGGVIFESKASKYFSWDSSGRILREDRANPKLKPLMFRSKAYFASLYHYTLSVQESMTGDKSAFKNK